MVIIGAPWEERAAITSQPPPPDGHGHPYEQAGADGRAAITVNGSSTAVSQSAASSVHDK